MIFKIVNSIRTRGVRATVNLVKERIISKYEFHQNLRFDAENGVETSKHEMIYAGEVKTENWAYSYNYEPVATKLFHESMSKIDTDLGQFIFLDLGSGKGKALMLAAEYPFRKIIGVEFSSQLHNIAKENITKFKIKNSNNFQLIHEDASIYRFPQENIILFLYNPFDGIVLEQVLKKIENHITRTSKDIYIVYHYPINSEIFDQNEFIKLFHSSEGYKIYSNKLFANS